MISKYQIPQFISQFTLVVVLPIENSMTIHSKLFKRQKFKEPTKLIVLENNLTFFNFHINPAISKKIFSTRYKHDGCGSISKNRASLKVKFPV